MCGKTRWTTNWGNGINTNIEGVTSDALALKYNEEGILLFAKTAGGIDSYDRTDGITVNSQGDIYISGMASNDIVFDDIIYESPEFQYYPFLAKMIQQTLSIPETHMGSIVIYPNPAESFLRVSNIQNDLPGSIYNMSGQKVKDCNLNAQKDINLSDLAKGTYIIQAKGFVPAKFIKL